MEGLQQKTHPWTIPMPLPLQDEVAGNKAVGLFSLAFCLAEGHTQLTVPMHTRLDSVKVTASSFSVESAIVVLIEIT